MSLIHEALKKAEQQRRLGEPPGLTTPFARSPRQRSLLPYLAAAIAVALGAAWFLTRDTAMPEKSAPATANAEVAAANSKTAPTTAAAAAGGTAPAASGADPASASSASEHRPTMGANAVANTGGVTTLAPPPANPPTVKELGERESEPYPPGTNPPSPGEPAPLPLGAAPPETPINDPTGLASKKAVKEKERGADTMPPSTPEPGRSPFIKERPSLPPAPTAKSPGPAPSGDTSGLVSPEKSAPGIAPPPVPPPLNPSEKAPTAGAAPEAVAPAEPPLEQLPVYWQLPYNVRKELPDLKMSMHVYSATPAQRFVVLNGNRQVEGDELGGEVHVSEIRQDGVVLTFHGQRFIVPRGGS